DPVACQPMFALVHVRDLGLERREQTLACRCHCRPPLYWTPQQDVSHAVAAIYIPRPLDSRTAARSPGTAARRLSPSLDGLSTPAVTPGSQTPCAGRATVG